MRKLFHKGIAVALCIALLANADFLTFAQDENKISDMQTVSQNESVSENDLVSGGDASDDISIVVNHYLEEAAYENMLFAPATYESVSTGDSILNVVRENNGFAAESVTLYEAEDGVKSSTGVSIMGELLGNEWKLDLTGDEYVIDVVYQETTGIHENGITIFDYTNGDASNKYSINYSGNYPSDVPYNQRMGTLGAQNDYVTLWEQVNEKGISRKLNINAYTRYDYNYAYVLEDEDPSNNKLWGDYRKQYPIIEGLLLGLDGEDYCNVNFRFADPGFFSNDGKKGKKVEEGYEFVFHRIGMTYELNSVKNEEKNVVLTDLSNFFPLSVGSSRKNEYFGIRYDFSFTLGDYVGDMIYSFAGDDDVWVCLDGEVILDLGGIHGVYPSTTGEYNSTATYAPSYVDVWTKILGKESYTLQDRIDYVSKAGNAEKEYTVTVLYMERGGWQSNCYIDFVMPNVVAAPPVVSTTASFPIYKVDADSREPISGVEFTLTAADNTVVGNKATDENGYLTFWGLEAGTYYLTETKAQSGYLPAGPWVVTVEESQNENIITPYVSKVTSVSDTTVELVKKSGYYVVENTSTKSVVDYDKTATLLNNQDRTYTINITAKVKDGDISFKNVQVVDYIDPRFEITQESRQILEASGAKIGNADGMEIVTWNGIILTTTPWEGNIIVKAKNDFLGGDEVPTNGPLSKIVINEVDFKLPIPKVDVRLLDLDIVGGETTVFLGEDVTPVVYWQEEVEGSLEADYTDSKQESYTFNLPALPEEKCEELFAKGICTVPYFYGDIQFGNLVYQAEGAPLEIHEALAVGTPYETYEFTVSYEAFDRTNNTNHFFGRVSADCEYDVNVIAGILTLKKTIYASDYKAVQGDPVFTFRVMKDGEFYAYSTVRFSEMKVTALKKTDDTVTLEVAVFENLEKGVYTIEELTSLRFNCVKIESVGTASKSSDVKRKEAVFEIGYDAEGNPTRVEGAVTFTNRKVKEDNFSDTDVVVNTCSFDNEGNLVWSADDLTGAQQ